MENRMKGAFLGVAGAALWFTPLATWQQEYMGLVTTVHQAGYHGGYLAYSLLTMSIAYGFASWFEHHQLRVVTGCIALGICLYLMIQTGSHATWGLYSHCVVSAVSAAFALYDLNRQEQSSVTQ